MKITSSGNGEYCITLDGHENAEFRAILEGWLDALEYHEYKSRGYKNRKLFTLGIKGEFVGFWRKAQKLYASVWETKTLTGEGTQEVLMDTFGSVGLMLHALRETSDKYAASWRPNPNKPTFGPMLDVSEIRSGSMVENVGPPHTHFWPAPGVPCACGASAPS